jgi:hypothetical protein
MESARSCLPADGYAGLSTRKVADGSRPLWQRYEQACDFLDDDLASGYVRVLQEMIAAGRSDHAVAERVVAMLRDRMDVLEDVAREAENRFGLLGPFTAADLALLVGMAFLGGEAVTLLGDAAWAARGPHRAAPRHRPHPGRRGDGLTGTPAPRPAGHPLHPRRGGTTLTGAAAGAH